MTHDQFNALVSRLENDARSNPGGYQFKVLLLAFLGNAYLGAILLLIVALWIVLLASLVVLKALAIKMVIVVGAFGRKFRGMKGARIL